MIKKLPKDVSALDREGLRRARDTRDERLNVLFRRWPSLTKIEMKEIRQLHDERLRLARYVGMLRERVHVRSVGGTGTSAIGRSLRTTPTPRKVDLSDGRLPESKENAAP